ncbi:hypothetical protein D039_2487B, partial [Vibrio parahaemolyticus EKP-028]
VNKSQ